MGAMMRSENGVSVLLPYAMPVTVDEGGERDDYGRYCIAYSRDGWWLIDADSFTVLRWCVSEEDALKARAALTH